MDVREEYLEKTRAELKDVEERGAVLAGNAFSPVLLLKGEPEQGGAGLLEGADGDALRAALQALGYAPQDWAALGARAADGSALDPTTLRLAVATLDPESVIALDEPAAQALRETFAEELAELESLDEATLAPGVVAQVLGMRMMALGGFAASLSDRRAKQRMWARLKQLPPLGEPY